MTAKLTGRHVLMALLGFFGCVMAVNGVFVYFATSTFTGLDAPKAYRSGVAYNRALDDARAQADLGWRAKMSVETESPETTLRIVLIDANGQPLQGLAVTAAWRRPTQAADDRVIGLSPDGPGRYAGAIVLPARGNWDLSIVAQNDAGQHFRIDRRIWVKP
ncbi:MAG: FixH family protein [Alphaproteobacteria bacterium]